jgi:hypothetical protein
MRVAALKSISAARAGAVSIFIDGVLVSDPYYGTFDVSSIGDGHRPDPGLDDAAIADRRTGAGGVIECTRATDRQRVVVARSPAIRCRRSMSARRADREAPRGAHRGLGLAGARSRVTDERW